jgi:hypothetical protein
MFSAKKQELNFYIQQFLQNLQNALLLTYTAPTFAIMMRHRAGQARLTIAKSAGIGAGESKNTAGP